ncbi:MAG: hypothetical protein LUF86_06835 [Clostridiales bacterium]|nr:hypothetical protein [Clostridiales bacterium]
MIKLELEISEVEYETLLDLLPQMGEQLRQSGNPVGMLLSNGMSSGMARRVLSTLSQEQKDKLAADLINGNSQKLIDKTEGLAWQNGVGLKIASLEATAR